MSLPKISRLTSGRDTITGSIHEMSIPKTGMDAAKASSRMILTMPNVPFSTGTQTALRRPVRTPSWSVKMPQAMTQAMKQSDGIMPRSSA